MVKKIKSQIGVESKDSLGFLFSYKESDISKKDDKTTITVSFKSGISKNFPSKFQKFEDFDVEQIFEGQTTELYIRPENYKEGFLKEKKDFDLDVNEA